MIPSPVRSLPLLLGLLTWVPPCPAQVDTQPAPSREHWAFQPMADPAPPPVADATWVTNAIDRFILAELEAAGLRPAPAADRSTLLRRASFDLLGLPPTPTEVEAFLADPDDDATAFARVLDRLLASPHYGERWGRRWLDLVRYADSNGADENLALSNAWRYRDYVVRALNADLPYDRFLSEQIAGDLLPPRPESDRDEASAFDPWIATGFWVLGPKMLAEQDKEKLVLDVIDEQLDVAGRAILGLTLGCARCHDHKFDPISAEDYYAMAGVLKSTRTMANLDHVSRWLERPLASDEAWAKKEEYERATKALAQKGSELFEAAEAARVTHWTPRIHEVLALAPEGLATVVVREAENADRTNLHHDRKQWGSPICGVLHTSQGGVQHAEWDISIANPGWHVLNVRYAAGESRPMRLLVDGKEAKPEILGQKTGGFLPDSQRWEVVAHLKLDQGSHTIRFERNDSVPHLDKICLVPVAGPDASEDWAAVIPGADGLPSPLLRNVITDLSSGVLPEHPVWGLWHAFGDLGSADAARWSERHQSLRTSVDPKLAAWDPQVRALLDGPDITGPKDLWSRYQTLFSLAASRQIGASTESDKKSKKSSPAAADLVTTVLSTFWDVQDHERESGLPSDLKQGIAEHRSAEEALKATKPKTEFPTVLCVREGKPEDLPVHLRGSHLNLASTVTPRGFLSVTDPVVPRPAIPAQQSGRLEWAARWTHPEHPLTARVLVNRLWQGHFGEGLVRTPSNFGLRGDHPSHPELLDWLARRFVAEGWSQKALHRLIMESSAYRMSSTADDAASVRDPDNHLISHMNRRRLDAETVRDAILAVSGSIDRSIGGSLLNLNNGAYVTNDQSGNQARYDAPRRSLYLPIIRNALFDLFTIFDYNDASVPVEQRPATVVPAQALFALNSPLVINEARRWGERLLRDVPDDLSRIQRAWQEAYGRSPETTESEACLRWIAQRVQDRAGPDRVPAAWQDFCQVLFASNAFLYVD